jgi:hypothetical protein
LTAGDVQCPVCKDIEAQAASRPDLQNASSPLNAIRAFEVFNAGHLLHVTDIPGEIVTAPFTMIKIVHCFPILK